MLKSTLAFRYDVYKCFPLLVFFLLQAKNQPYMAY